MKKLFILVSASFILFSCDKQNFDNSEASIVDGEGYVYQTVTIGSQVWLTENLKTSFFLNGTPIPTTTPLDLRYEVADILDAMQWPVGLHESNVAEYGRHYTYQVAVDGRKVCPEGFKVPSESDWQTLIDFTMINNYKAEDLMDLSFPVAFYSDGYVPPSPTNILGLGLQQTGRHISTGISSGSEGSFWSTTDRGIGGQGSLNGTFPKAANASIFMAKPSNRITISESNQNLGVCIRCIAE